MGRSLQWIVCFALVAATLACPAAVASDAGPAIAESPLEPARELVVLAGASRVLTFAYVQRVAVADPAVADVVVPSQQEVLVNGLAPGFTTLHIWLKSERVTYNIRVISDLAVAIDELRALLADPDVNVATQKDTLILSGTVPSLARKERAVKLAQVFSSSVVDLLTVATSDAAQVIAQTIGDPNITVSLHGETAILEGKAAGENAKKRAEDIARAFAGKVVNLIEVDTGAQLAIDLAGIITKMIDDEAVRARTVGQSIFLEGEVGSEAARQRAEQIARALTNNVVNLIQVAQVEIIRGTTVSASTAAVSVQQPLTPAD